MKKIVFIYVFLLIIVTFINSEALFMPESKEVEELKDLYILSGKVMPSDSYPFSRTSMIEWAVNLKDSSTSEAVEQRLNDLINSLTAEHFNNAFELDWQIGYEHYFRTEEMSEDPVSDYLEELPLATLGTSFVNYAYGGTCLELSLKREYSTFPESNLFENKPNNPIALENQIVQKGYAYFENDWIFLALGRLPSHFGNPEFSSFMANQNLPFFDQVKMDMNISSFRLEYFIASIENRIAEGDLPVPAQDFGEYSIWTTMHRLVYSFNTFRVSLAEQAFISRENNQLYIADISPLMVSHNAWLSNVNISTFADINWVIIPGLEFYYQLGFDDISATDVFGIADSGLPTIDAHILGLSFQREFAESQFWVKFELGNTHYLWGSFDAAEPFEEAIYRIYLDGNNQLIPFSSPYGPGAFWVDLESEIKTSIGLEAALNIFYLKKNLAADLITTAYERADDEMQEASHKHLFEVGLSMNYKVFEVVDVYFEPALLTSFISGPDQTRSNENSWFECTIGCNFSGNMAFGL